MTTIPDADLMGRFLSKFDAGNPGECWLWNGTRQRTGYGIMHIKRNGRFTNYTASHLALRFLRGQALPPGMQVCHSCDNPPCVNPAHLWIGTSHDNHVDMLRKGRQKKPGQGAKGERNWTAKLTASDVIAIRERSLRGERAVTLAQEFGVDPVTIWSVKAGRTWRHIPVAAGEGPRLCTCEPAARPEPRRAQR